MRALLLVFALSFWGTGCACTVGIGLGAGAEVKLAGALHTGLIGWGGIELGPHYGHKTFWSLVGGLPFLHYEEYTGALVGVPSARRVDHFCVGLLPGIASRGRNDHPFALEVRVALGFLSLRFGVDPIGRCDHGPEADGPEEIEEQAPSASSKERR